MTGGFSGNSATLWRVPVDFKKQGYRRKLGSRAGTKTGKKAGRYRSRPGRHLPVLLEDRPGAPAPALETPEHPAVRPPLVRDPFGAPEPDRDLALGEPFRLALQRQQKLAVAAVPRSRPGRGTGAPSQTSSMRTTSRISRRPPSSGKTVPGGRRTRTERPGCSILSISAPPASLSPESAAPPSAASRTSGAASRATWPSITPACAQKGESGSSAQRSSQAAMPQAMAARSAEVWRRMGNGPRSGRPGIGRRFRHAVRYALLARMKRHALSASQPPTRRAIVRRPAPTRKRPAPPAGEPGAAHADPWMRSPPRAPLTSAP